MTEKIYKVIKPTVFSLLLMASICHLLANMRKNHVVWKYSTICGKYFYANASNEKQRKIQIHLAILTMHITYNISLAYDALPAVCYIKKCEAKYTLCPFKRLQYCWAKYSWCLYYY